MKNAPIKRSMSINRKLGFLGLTTSGIVVSGLLAAPVLGDTNGIADKGAQIYCFMRSTGNAHEVSWNAAYEIIKRQKSSLFKTSPTHAAVMIVEAVVKEPNQYPNCGSYLGDLFNGDSTKITEIENLNTEPSKTNPFPDSSANDGDRYSY